MQTVLILGATSTVAMELAILYAKRGAKLQLASRDIQRLNPLKSDLAIRFNTTVNLIEFDVEDTKSHTTFYQSLDTKPDIVVCLFGFLGKQEEAIVDWHIALKIFNVNFVGAVSILNIISRDFKTKQKGVLVGVSSVAGERGRQSNYMYGSAKAGFTTYLSDFEMNLVSRKVQVITINPGFIRSKMIAGIDTPAILTASPGKVAHVIIKAVEKKRDVVYVLWIWRWIMLIIKLFPESLFKKLNL
jgi:decaprenylphospho-beta-D-erythro-pentofuranosid-2-ulose 2-reductase